MRRFFPVICALFIFTAAAVAEEQPRGGQGLIDSTGNTVAGKDQAAPGNTGHGGYTVFPIQAPERYKDENNARNEMPDDSAFTDSLRMLLGLGGPKPPACFRQPRDRGLLRDE
jgi:hypothetical protein